MFRHAARTLPRCRSRHLQALLSLQPLTHLAEPEEIAETLVFLTSDAGSHYTGQILSPSAGAYLAG
ncbi:SDR family oxidoreductase [Corynebacterium faecale]